MKFVFSLAVCIFSASLDAAALSPVDLYRTAAQEESPGFKAFSAARGDVFYHAKSGEVSCASCHGASPKEQGKHTTTGKEIAPMATSVNPQRFTDQAKTEKWFRRNCNDVLKRPCSAMEKGDFITYLSSVK